MLPDLTSDHRKLHFTEQRVKCGSIAGEYDPVTDTGKHSSKKEGMEKNKRVACAAQRRFRCKPDCVHVRYNHHQTVMISAINIIIISPFFL